MMNQQSNVVPTISELETFLTAYGWKYQRDTLDDGRETLLAPFPLDEQHGIILMFNIAGEFVQVYSVGLFRNIPIKFSLNLLQLQDRVKLIKIYAIPSQSGQDFFDAEVAFELWNESWNQGTFFAFMDMLCMGIENLLVELTEQEIPFDPNFISFE